MCGICGIFDPGLEPEAKTSLLQRMSLAMLHRGPDDSGLYIGGPVGLAMRRLSIIDVAGGRQPVFNEDGAVCVISNGEIYNFQALTTELEASGHRFHTRSDTETIVHAYEQWGTDCVCRLRGMFAFAVYDQRLTVQRSTLFLARDRLGIKPLYYYQGDGYFLFASEVRALLASRLVPRRLSLAGLASYLAYGSVQEPLTLVEGIYSLLPGHRMSVKEEIASSQKTLLAMTTARYWDMPVPQELEMANCEWRIAKEIAEAIGALLTEAVGMRLISEVPLGAFLSGGIDSSSVVTLMSQVSQAPVRTFTIGFQEREFDESNLARATAKRCQTEHHQIVITPQQVLNELPAALEAMDQPTMNGINTYYVSKATKEAGMTVALSGLGGDEIFGGYDTFRTLPWMMRFQAGWRFVPDQLKGAAAHLFAAASPKTDRHRKLASFIAGGVYFDHPYYIFRALFTPQQLARLLSLPIPLDGDNPWCRSVDYLINHAAAYDPINAISYLECRNYLVSTLLRDTDFMSMAHNLEVRVPLIDHKLVEYVIQLPGRLKGEWRMALGARIPKPLLIEALRGMLLPEVIYQPKRTFTFPWARWLKDELRREVEDALRTGSIVLKDVLNVKEVERLWAQFLAGRVSWSRVWALYVLQKWADRHLS